ncbi:MAG: 3-deoxy-D-manno-octulosonic acid transferase [Fibrobacteres bacterium]|nr:3-deoxy-D-manno-octulosonic acid transferase [Fibrobacterota bacterium]
MMRFHLAVYRWAWHLLLAPALFLNGLDRRLRAMTGIGFIPGTWRVTERAGAGPGARPAGSAGKRALWLHCASLGEAKGMWAFTLSLAEADDIILTANTHDGAAFLERQCAVFSKSSFAAARRIVVSIAPFDHPSVVGRFLERHGVRGLCLYEVELWPHYLSGCRERDLPVALVSGRLTEKAYALYRRFGGAGARLLDGLAWIQAQSPEDAERFRSLTTAEVCLGFDFKAAHYLRHRDLPETIPPQPRFLGAASRFAFVSLHFSELTLLRPGLARLMERFDLVVFPRKLAEVNRFRSVLEPMGFETHSRNPNARHLLVDALGLVEERLPECGSVFVGGSLIPLGCHNLWEPLLVGAQIRFGPYFENQRTWAGLLLECGIAEVVRDPAALGACPSPSPENATACATLVQDLRQDLESALTDGKRRIFVTFYPNVNARTAAQA